MVFIRPHVCHTGPLSKLLYMIFVLNQKLFWKDFFTPRNKGARERPEPSSD